jgi:hypothetical protein
MLILKMLFIMNLAKMSAFLFNCNEQWQLKQRLPEKQELRYANEIKKRDLIHTFVSLFHHDYVFNPLYISRFICQSGHCCGGRTKGVTFFNGSCKGDFRKPISFAGKFKTLFVLILYFENIDIKTLNFLHIQFILLLIPSQIVYLTQLFSLRIML